VYHYIGVECDILVIMYIFLSKNRINLNIVIDYAHDFLIEKEEKTEKIFHGDIFDEVGLKICVICGYLKASFYEGAYIYW